MENTRRISFASPVSLHDASIQTHSAQLNPVRDGVHSRVHRILVRYVEPVAIGAGLGTAIGVGAYKVHESYLNTPITSSTTPIISSTTPESSNINGDDIINSL